MQEVGSNFAKKIELESRRMVINNTGSDFCMLFNILEGVTIINR